MLRIFADWAIGPIKPKKAPQLATTFIFAATIFLFLSNASVALIHESLPCVSDKKESVLVSFHLTLFPVFLAPTSDAIYSGYGLDFMPNDPPTLCVWQCILSLGMLKMNLERIFEKPNRP